MAKAKVKGLTVEVNGDTIGLKKALSQAEEMVKRYDKQLKTLNKALNTDPTNADNITKKQNILREAIDATVEELEQYADIQKQLESQGVKNSSAEWMDVENRIISAKSKLVEYQGQLSTLSTSTIILKENLDKVSKTTGDLAGKTALISATAAAGIFAMSKSAMSYESNIASIKKVVKDLSDDTVNSLKAISVETGVAFDEISAYASMAGTLGIAEKDISAFAKAMTDLNTATGGAISGEEGAKSVARFLNIVKVGTDEVGNFGSALTGVADKFATTADEVLETSSAMAGLASVFDVDQYDIVGISAVLQSLGVSSAVSASTMTKTFQTIELAVESGGAELERFASTAGMTADEFVNSWKSKPMETMLDFADGLQGAVFGEINDAIATNSDSLNEYAQVLGMTKNQFIEAFGEDNVGTLSKYIDAIGELGDEEESAITILDELGLSGVRFSQVLLKLSGNGDTVKKAIQGASTEWEKNTALTDKAGTIYETTERKIAGAVEDLKQAGATLGDAFIPIIQDGAQAVKDFAEWFKKLDDNTKKTMAKTAAFVAVLSPMLKLTNGITGSIGGMITGYDKIKTAMSKMSTTAATASGNMGLFQKAVLGIGSNLPVVGIGIAALVAGVAAVDGAMSAYKDSIAYKNGEIMKSIDEVMTKYQEQYSEDVIRIQTQRVMAEDQVENIEMLMEKYEAEKKAGKDVSDSKNDIITAIGNLNSSMDGSNYYWDENTNRIMDQNGEVQNLKKSIQELAVEQQKQAWLESYTAAYQESLEKSQEQYKLIQDSVKERSDYMSDLKDADENLFAAYEKYVNATGEARTKAHQEMLELAAVSDQEASNILFSLTNVDQQFQDLSDNFNKTKKEADAMHDNIKKVSEAEGELAQKFMQTVDWGLNIDPMKNNLSEIEQQIDDVTAEIEAGVIFNYDTTEAQAKLAELQSQQDTLLKVKDMLETSNVDLITSAQASSDNLFAGYNTNIDETNDHAVEKSSETMGLIKDETLSAFPEIAQGLTTAIDDQYNPMKFGVYDPIHEAQQIFQADWNRMNLDKVVTLHIRTEGEGVAFNNSYTGGGSDASGVAVTQNITFNGNYTRRDGAKISRSLDKALGGYV